MEDNDTVTSVFLTKRFDGTKTMTRQLLEEIERVVSYECGTFGVDYAFPRDANTQLPTEWPLDVHGIPEYSADYRKVEVPQPLADNANANTVLKHEQIRKMRREENQAIENMLTKVKKIIEKRCDAAINLELCNGVRKHHPYLWIKHIRDTYGALNATEQEKGNLFIGLLGEYMKPTEKFNSAYIQWCKKAGDAELTASQKLGLLLVRKTDPINTMGLQFLPDRLSEAVKYCRTNAQWNLEQCVRYIREADDVAQHTTASSERRNVKSMKSDGGRPCWNCRNYGHTAYDCLSPWCGFCMKPDCGHNSVTCPLRLKQQSGDVKKRNRDDVREDTDSVGDIATNRDDGVSQSGVQGNRNKNKRGRGRGRGRGRSGGNRSQKLVSASYESDNDESDSDMDTPVYLPESYISKARPVTQRPIRRVRSDISEADSDVDMDMDDDESDTITSIKSITSSRTRVHHVSRDYLDFDTGADEWLFNKPKLLDNVRPFNESGTRLTDASGHEMTVTSIGNFKNMTDRALVSKDLNCTCLMSGPRLQEAGFSIILPAWTPEHRIGLIVYDDKDGKVVAVGNREMKVDPATINSYNQHVIKPDFSKVVNSVRIRPVTAIYGKSNTSVVDMVHFIQSCFHFTKKDTLFLCKAIDNFPVTSEQVNKYYSQDVHYIKGHLQHRKVDQSQFMTSSERDKRHQSDVSSTVAVASVDSDGDDELPEERNITPGYQVGVDFFGPVANVSILASVDKATGYRISTDMRHSSRTKAQVDVVASKKNIVEHLRSIFKDYEKYGHHAHNWNAPIKYMIADSDPVFRSKAVRVLLQDETITPKYSPPRVHALNGLAESRNRGSIDQVISMWSAARWMPQSTFAFCWKLADLILNLKASRRPEFTHMTRHEDFRHERPNWKTLCILPWGCPVEARFHVSEPDGTSTKLVDKSVTGAYLMPDLESTNGAIYVWNFQTKRKFSAYTYRILQDVPMEFQQLAADYKGVPLAMRQYNTVVEEEGVVTEDDDDGAVDSNETTTPASASTDHVMPSPVINVSSSEGVPKHVRFELPAAVSDSEGVSVVLASTPALTPIEPIDTDVIPVTPEPTPVSPPPILPVVDEVSHTSVSSAPVEMRPRRHARGATPWKTRFQTSEGGSSGALKLHAYHEFDFDLSSKGSHVKPMAETLRSIRLLMNEKYHKGKVGKWRAERHAYLQRVHTNSTNVKSKKARRIARKQRREDSPTDAQIQKRPDRQKFMDARDEELRQLGKDGEYAFDLDKSFVYKDLPKGAVVFNSMFVDKIKRNATTKAVDKYKARLVVLGNQQHESTYDQVKSGTARGSSVKLLIALQAKLKAKSMVLDVKGAFLKSEITDPEKTKFYLRLPDGRIVLLRKYLYGLKQAGYQWMVNVTDTLSDDGYKPTADPLVFTKRVDDDYIHLSLHVDDFYVISSSDKLLDDLESYLKSRYGEISRKSGDVVEYVGMSIKKDPVSGDITISQPAYVDKMISLMKLDSVNGAPTPMSAGSVTTKDNDDVAIDKTTYLEAVGLINYLAIFTRPDLLYSLSRAAQRCSNPTNKDMRMVKRIFRNIIATRDYGVTYKSSGNLQLTAHVDASYNCYPDGKSHYGYTLSLGQDNGSFMAKSGKIKLVTQSSAEAEYVALCNCAKEVTFVRRLLNDLGVKQQGPTAIYEDNMSTIKMVNGGMSHEASKHINPKYHFTKELVLQKVVTVIHKPSDQMTADLLTKPLFTDDHKRLTDMMLNRRV